MNTILRMFVLNHFCCSQEFIQNHCFIQSNNKTSNVQFLAFSLTSLTYNCQVNYVSFSSFLDSMWPFITKPYSFHLQFSCTFFFIRQRQRQQNDKTTSQIQSTTEKSVIFITNLQSLHYRQQQGHRVTAWWCNYPSTEHWHSWVISFIIDIRTALESLDWNGSSKKVQISLSMETVK